MLQKLTIENIALITHLELDFCDKLNILSGETGAGKSIIVDGLMLLLGGRYDKTLLRYGESSGYVEGVFDVTDKARSALEALGLENDDVAIVTRRFTAEGRNEIRVNGRTVTTSMLKSVMSTLVDIYGQNEYQSLTNPLEHLRILDYYAREAETECKTRLTADYARYREVVKELKSLGNLEERERNIDILRFQTEEIEAAAVKPGEDAEIAEQRQLIAGAERIRTALGAVADLLTEGEWNVSSLLGDAVSTLNNIPVDRYAELYERLNSAAIEIDDIADSILHEFDDMNFDEEQIDRVEKRYDLLAMLKRKYGPYEKMQKFLTEAKQELYRLENCADLYEQLEREKQALIDRLYDNSVSLSEIRRQTAEKLAENVEAELAELGMRDSKFEVVFADLPVREDCEAHLTANGLDHAEFYLSPNLGQPLKPLIKIISGGEMSRFMLALKVITSRTDDIPTLIFDEIDTGISGLIGQAVAKKLAKISRVHQVLCVTHLPQIASMADNHYYIEKAAENGTTVTNVRLLNAQETAEEISRLSGSKDISSATLKNAEEMKRWSDEYKASLE